MVFDITNFYTNIMDFIVYFNASVIQDGRTYIQHYFVVPDILFVKKDPTDQPDNPLDHLKAQDIARLIIDEERKVQAIENIRISGERVLPYDRLKAKAIFTAFRTGKSIEQILAELQ